MGAGTVYAASRISGAKIRKSSLPGNRVKGSSLPGNRIKPGTVTGTQVKESSLGTVPSAERAGSAASANLIYGGFNDDGVGLPYQADKTIVTIAADTGAYAVFGKLVAHNNDSTGPDANVECFIFAGEDASDQVNFQVPPGGDVPVSLQTTTSFSRPNSMTLDCLDHGGNVTIEHAKLAAIQAAGASNVNSG